MVFFINMDYIWLPWGELHLQFYKDIITHPYPTPDVIKVRTEMNNYTPLFYVDVTTNNPS